MKIITLKIINLIIGGIAIFLLTGLYFTENHLSGCLTNGTTCNSVHAALLRVSGAWLFLLVPFSFFAVITFFSKDSLTRYWSYFSYVWIFLTYVLIQISDKTSGGFGVVPSLNNAASVFLISIVLYVLLSILIIYTKSWQLQK